jgi:phosphocarrier protein
MYSKSVVVINKTGIHARPATEFVKTAAKFKSKIWFEKEGKPTKADAKSIIFVLTMGVKCGDKITISAEGEDETSAVDTLVKLVEDKIGEIDE